MTQRIDPYRAAFSVLWQTSIRNGLIEGEFPGFSEEHDLPEASLPASEDAELFRIARACQPRREIVLARGGERLRFFGEAFFDDAGKELPLLDWPCAPLVADAEGNWICLARDLSDRKLYLYFLACQETLPPKERPQPGPSFFILTSRLEYLPAALRAAIDAGEPLLAPAARLLDPGRPDPRFPPLDVRAELKNKKYLLFLLPAVIEFIETLFVRKPGSELPLHFIPGLLLVAVHLYGSSSRPRRLRLFVFGFYAGFFAIFAGHVAALWLRGDMAM